MITLTNDQAFILLDAIQSGLSYKKQKLVVFEKKYNEELLKKSTKIKGMQRTLLQRSNYIRMIDHAKNILLKQIEND